MIFGIGTDIIEVSRIEKSIQSETFKNRIFTSLEQEYCDTKKTYGVHYAARYAVKEAFFKALGTGWRGELKFTDVEVINDELGKPNLRLTGEAKNRFEIEKLKAFVSISHIKDYATAYVIIEKIV